MSQVFRFGIFQFDEETGELRKGQTLLKLQPQPARLLRLLLTHAGNVVKRAEIQKAVWGDDVVVDYESGVNRCIRQIRTALLDNPDSPRYVETVPRTGYRFIAPLLLAAAVDRDSEVLPSSAPAHLAPEPALHTPEIARAKAKRLTSRNVALLALAGLLAIAVSWHSLARGHHIASNLEPLPLTSYLGNQSSPAFSPDGREVAFVWNGEKQDNFDIYVKLIGSSRLLRITSDPAIDYGPAWSPDGRSIAFCRGTEKQGGALYIVSALGGPERKLVDLKAVATPADQPVTWSQDGKWLVLADSEASPGHQGLALVNVLSGESSALTLPPAGVIDLYPTTSPSGNQIAFTRVKNDETDGIYVLPFRPDQLAKVEPRQLRWRGIKLPSAARPAWTPDAQRIVFDSGYGGSPRLWIADARDGAEPQVLTVLGSKVLQPAISLSGQLAYMHYSDPGVNIWRTSLNRSKPFVASAPLRTVASVRDVRSGTVSPDGKKLAFGSDQSGFDEIWRSNLDGSDPVQVTNMGKAGSGSPAWSPDGHQIVFDSRAAGEPDLYIIPADGGAYERIMCGSGMIPVWSPDQRWIYFTSKRTGSLQIWRTSPKGGTPEQITQLGGFAAKVSPDNRFLYYMRSATPVSSLQRLDLANKMETQMAESVYTRAFAPVKEGVYYFSGPPYQSQSLNFFSFDSGLTENLLTVPKLDSLGIAVTPNGRTLFYGQYDDRTDELMIVENFWK